ncbi:MAG: penicillin-binding transpeptidase domain-containing protein [Oscillospiraceae bacterium]
MNFASIAKKIRTIILIAFVLLAMSMCALALMKMQIVDGEKYLEQAKSTRTVTQDISAPRGEIVDASGKAVVSNKVGYNVILEKAFLSSDVQEINRIILRIAEILDEDGVEWNESLPISRTAPYSFLEMRDSDIAKLRKNISVQPYATAEECIEAMLALYKVDDSYTVRQKRIIVGIRYEMAIRSFSLANRYTLAEDIPMASVVKLKEAAFELEGMDVAEEAIRVYEENNYAPHLVGTVGSINAEEYETLKESGYMLNDVLGKSGVEKAMESQLRGTMGTRELELLNGIVSSDTITKETVPGNTVKLTIDMDYQHQVQQILENHITWLQNQTSKDKKGENANAGAIVVTDAKTGALIAAATSPTYNINDYLNNYSAVANGENSPLINRATSGLYRPGSTFKTVTATAGLNEGVISPNTFISCNKVYTYWEDYQPKCTGYHGRINVVTAIEKSCNIFFYETGRQLGIDRLAGYAKLYGFGQNTGLETGDMAGYFATPESFQERRLEWQAGLVVQAAIGQSETYATPLQLAMLANTIANHGTRYKPYVVDSVYTYNMERLVIKTQPTVAANVPDETGVTFDNIIKGMENAANFVPYSYPAVKDYYTNYLLSELPQQAAIKTGTPQMTSAEDTGSAFIGFYPSEDPVIAFSGFVEHGDYSKFMIRQIIEAYFNKNYKVASPNVLTDEERAALLAGIGENVPAETVVTTFDDGTAPAVQ